MIEGLLSTFLVGLLVFVIGIVVMLLKTYRKVEFGKALLRTGFGGVKVSFTGLPVVPIIHRADTMDISVKRVEIERSGKEGLICKDNIRADIRVAFFVRVNKTAEDVMKVAQSIGCARASDQQEMVELFDAKFSEALKTIGKQFNFEELYISRERVKEEILNVIGTDLNGYIMDDAAIDFLEQTPMSLLDPKNILDSQGIKKITDITSEQRILTNKREREAETLITQQDTEAKEAILELNRQGAEAEEKQRREVANIKARESAEILKVQQEERLRAEQTRIHTEEEIEITEQNKERQVIVARKNKERTDAIETERVDKERLLEVNEKERIVELANIEKERAVEEEKKNIMEVVRQRVMVEKSVVEEEERIKETRVVAEANRDKQAAIIQAEKAAEEARVKQVKAADAAKEAAKLKTEQLVIEAEAERQASEKQAESKKLLAEALAAEEAALGMSEVQVMEAKAIALEKQGSADAAVMEKKALAEAKGIEAKARAKQIDGEAEALVLSKKLHAEAAGIEEKAKAMKQLDGAGREHEEFKLRLAMKKEIELAQITIQKDIADAQAQVLREGLKSARIEIIGGEPVFFERIIQSMTLSRSVDRFVQSSNVMTDIKDSLLKDGHNDVITKIRQVVQSVGLTSSDIKNLTLSALVVKLLSLVKDEENQNLLTGIQSLIVKSELGKRKADTIL